MSKTSITKEQIHDLQRLLTQRYSQLSKHVDGGLHAETRKEISITVQSDADRTTADQDADDAIARVERDVNELSAIEAALSRIRNGSYGICSDCASFIDFPRLVAHPTASRCLTCQESFESKRK
jgi:DnaK suppressor protein